MTDQVVRHPSDLQHLLAIIDQAYDRQSWHGTNLRGSIRRVSPEEAAWRPNAQAHNIWEIVLHAAYWKYTVQRRFAGEKRGPFPLKGSNWFRRPVDLTEPAWRADIALLDDMHRRLRGLMTQLTPKDLSHTPPGRKVSNFALIAGIAAHDLYHAGQIQLLKRLAPRRV